MKVLITGAGGMLGTNLIAEANAVHHEVCAVTREELDITDFDAVVDRFERELPAVVVNCAAFTDVDGAEDREGEAFRINADGAGNVAAAAAHIGAKVIHVSTDYVFDGTKQEPYVESDPTAPIGAYGRTKLAGEAQVEANNPRHLIVRTSWLFGIGGKNFVETMLTLAGKQNEVLVVADQFGCPTYARELAAAIVEQFDFERLGVMHVAGEGVTTWFDFAREIFRQSQLETSVMSGTTSMLGRPAPRPVNSALVSERDDAPKLKRWDHGLHAYLIERSQQETEAEA